MEVIMIVYKATNKKTGKSYIGQTSRALKARKAEHLNDAANISRSTRPTLFQKAIHEFGSGEFEWEVLETCSSLDHLNEREKFYIKLLNTNLEGYNQTSGGAMDGSMSIDIRARIAEGVRKLHQDPEYKARVYPKLKGLTPPNKGVPMSNEQKAKVSAAKKAVYSDPTYINPNAGQKRTKEQIDNIKAGQAGKMATGSKWTQAHGGQYTDEVREKMRQKKLGKKPANTKKVLCNETSEVFNGLTEAAKSLNVNRQSIYLQIKGKLKLVASKYTFKYVE
jgi:group I intron endonuclease